MRLIEQVKIYTDGGAWPNPGLGGYGTIIIFPNEEEIELSECFRLTTNNRMEMLAAIKGLEELDYVDLVVTIYSDSQYLVNGIQKGWAKNWKSRNWIKSDAKEALNCDLWGKLLKLCSYHQVRFKWIRGHDGNEYNDNLALKVRNSIVQKVDRGYENA